MNITIYSCVHERLLKHADQSGEIKRRKIYEVIGMIYHIPKELREQVVKDLIDLGLLKKVDKFKMIVVKR